MAKTHTFMVDYIKQNSYFNKESCQTANAYCFYVYI